MARFGSRFAFTTRSRSRSAHGVRQRSPLGFVVAPQIEKPRAEHRNLLAARVVAEAFDYLDAPPTRVTGKDVPMPYAANLEKLALPSADEVVAAVNAVTYRS